MNSPEPGEYIDIHTHDSKPDKGIFAVENIMAHENLQPETISAKAFTAGIHPWHLNENNREELLEYVRKVADSSNLIAFGEAGFDKLRGPSMELQKSTFEEQLQIAGEKQKPVIIHCVRAWDELLTVHRNLKPEKPWLVHGFRGKIELALQLIKRGMYLSFWFDFVLRQESAELLRSLPKEKIFFETDGANVDIREIYRKVSVDLEINLDELKRIILNNFNLLFNKSII
jgi:TatD DNase family protein